MRARYPEPNGPELDVIRSAAPLGAGCPSQTRYGIGPAVSGVSWTLGSSGRTAASPMRGMPAVAAGVVQEEPLSPYVASVEGFGRQRLAPRGERRDLLLHIQGARCIATIAVLYHHDWYFSGGGRSYWGRTTA